MIIGYCILNFRKKNNLTQKQIALMFKCQQSQVSKWERGINKPSKLRMKSIMETISAN